MNVAYVDSSWLLAVLFDEPAAAGAASVLAEHDVLLSSALLEAEVLAALRREGVAGTEIDPGISWILPDRPLRPEIERVLANGYLRGADLWHIACAAYAATDPRETSFLTFDLRQREAARQLGFDVRDAGE